MSLHAILLRVLSELNEQIVEHGERVAYLYLKMAEYRGMPDDKHLEHMMLALRTISVRIRRRNSLICFASTSGIRLSTVFTDIFS